VFIVLEEVVCIPFRGTPSEHPTENQRVAWVSLTGRGGGGGEYPKGTGVGVGFQGGGGVPGSLKGTDCNFKRWRWSGGPRL
jgi:hypothetical protein